MSGQTRQTMFEQAANAEEDEDCENAVAFNTIKDDSDSLDSDDFINFLEKGPTCPSLTKAGGKNYKNPYWYRSGIK